MSTRFLACRDIVTLVTDYLEGALDGAQRERVELHLVMCPACVEYVAQMRRTVEISEAAPQEDLDPRAMDSLLNAFRDWRRSNERG